MVSSKRKESIRPSKFVASCKASRDHGRPRSTIILCFVFRMYIGNQRFPTRTYHWYVVWGCIGILEGFHNNRSFEEKIVHQFDFELLESYETDDDVAYVRWFIWFRKMPTPPFGLSDYKWRIHQGIAFSWQLELSMGTRLALLSLLTVVPSHHTWSLLEKGSTVMIERKRARSFVASAS
jgi:hypothetical protein